MKKIVSLLLAVCMCVSFAVILTSCGEDHTHTYKTEWSHDATHHWHACEGEGCIAVSDKAEHTWDNGVDVVAGSTTYTCTVCAATNVETAPVEEIWESVLEMDSFDNVTCRFYGEFDDDEEFDVTFKLDGDVYYMEEDGYSEVGDEPELVETLKNVYISTVLGVLENFENFTYDSTNNVYVSNVDIVYSVNVLGIDAQITAKNAVVTINANEKLASMTCNMKQEAEDTELNLTVTFEFSDYGTTVIETEPSNS